jgi:hypothetical protein
VLRNPKWLQRYAQLIESDLSQTLDGTWVCTVSEEYVLRVTGPAWEGVVEIDAEVEEDEEDEAEYALDPDGTIDRDACEAVVDQVVELLGNAQVDWPFCRVHDARMEAETGLWSCAGTDHVVSVGELGAHALSEPRG